MKNMVFYVCCLASTVFLYAGLSPAEDGAAELFKDSIPIIARLNQAQKAQLEGLLKDIANYGVCEEDLSTCLNKKPADPLALKNANITAFLISKGVKEEHIRRIISEKAKFAKDTRRAELTVQERPTDGNPQAPIVLADFAEFKCPFCGEFLPLLHRIVSASNGMVRAVFKHFPLKSHKGSLLSSCAAEAAHRQGKFWEMAALLFKDMNNQEREHLEAHAASLGLDTDRFKADLEDQAIVKVIERDKEEGLAAGISGTPSLYINGKAYNLPRHDSFIKDAINEEAVLMGLTPPFPGNLFAE